LTRWRTTVRAFTAAIDVTIPAAQHAAIRIALMKTLLFLAVAQS